MKRQKYILTDQIKKYNMLEKVFYLGPLGVFLWGFNTGWGQLTEVGSYHNGTLTVFFIFTYLLSCIAVSLPLVFIGRYLIRGFRFEAIKKSSFQSVEGIKYYRDELEALSPVEISYLTDLGLEVKKDITAQLLQYELWGVIKYTDHGMDVVNPDDSRLAERDKILLSILQSGSTDYSRWESRVREDMLKSPYFFKSKEGRPRMLKVANNLMIVAIIGFIIFAVINQRLAPNGEELFFFQILDMFSEPENFDFSSFRPTAIQMYQMYGFVILIGMIHASFLTSLGIAFVFRRYGQKSDMNIARTREGNRLTELIYGLKNYIHDFTLLKERERNALLLWDYLLIYAVLLEENKEIVKEIMGYQKNHRRKYHESE